MVIKRPRSATFYQIAKSKMNLGLIIKETLYLGGIYWRHADVNDSAVVMRVLFSLFLIDLIKREKVFLADEKRQSHFRPK